jgi:hypothetical protein
MDFVKEYTESPYREIPSELLAAFTRNNTIPILNWYLDGTNDLEKKIWDDEYILDFMKQFTFENVYTNNINEPYCGSSCVLLKSFEKYDIKNKRVAVIGSITPWIEAILLNLKNQVTTVEYNVPDVNTTLLSCTSYWDFEKTSGLYDCIVTFSSIEHSGLGRYGDPLDPDGDIKCMDVIHKNLVENGTLIWGAPCGHDALVWNAHRIYGHIRLPILFKNFQEMDWMGYNKDDILSGPLQDNSVNPVIVLKKI